MRTSTPYTDENRRALEPADDDRLPVWQKDPKTGSYTQRWMGRATSEQRIMTLVDAALEAMQRPQTEILAQLAARKQVITLPDVTVTANQLITLTAGERTFSNLPCAGVKTTDTIIVTPKTMPPGTGLRGWSIPNNGRIALVVQCPILTLGDTALTVSVTAFR